MTISQYALGTSYPPTNLELFSPTPISVPMQSKPEKFSVIFPRGDSSQAGHGFPFTIWLFQVLNQDEMNGLLAILTVGGSLLKSRTGLYIKTRKPEDMSVFADYTATMLLPDNLTGYRQPNGLYINVPFEFRRLVPYP